MDEAGSPRLLYEVRTEINDHVRVSTTQSSTAP
jgi:hypothetical protein